jgi:hypothetical protein
MPSRKISQETYANALPDARAPAPSTSVYAAMIAALAKAHHAALGGCLPRAPCTVGDESALRVVRSVD